MHLVFDTWPEQIAEPIAREVVNVLTVQRSDLLTFGVAACRLLRLERHRGAENLAQPRLPRRRDRSFIYRRIQSLVSW